MNCTWDSLPFYRFPLSHILGPVCNKSCTLIFSPSLTANGLCKRMPIEILGVLNVVKQRTVRWLFGQRHFELQLFKPLGQGGLGVFVDLFPRLRFAETRMRSIWKLKQDDKVERLRKCSVHLERISLNELRGLNIFLHSSCIFEQ